MRSRLPLLLGRLVYAAAAGFALIVALQDPADVANIGSYVYQAGIAAAVATVATLGLDRVLARRVAATEIPVAYPTSVLRLRAQMSLGFVVAAFLASLVVGEQAALGAATAFIVTRLFYADVEAFWIAAKCGDGTLGVALAVNGAVTAAGILLAAGVSAPLMTAISAAGNVAGLAVLLARGRLPVQATPLPGLLDEARGMGLSVTLGVLYARSDLVVLAVTGVSPASVAFYGIVTRLFDAAALIRGALAQQETRELAPLPPERRVAKLGDWARQVQATATVSAAGLITLLFVARPYTGLGDADVLLLLSAVAVVPLFFSHLPTTTMVFSDRRTGLLLRGSILTTLGSVAVKIALVATWSVSGAVISLGLVEYMSCLVFVWFYWRPRERRPVVSVVVPPVLGALFCWGLVALVSI